LEKEQTLKERNDFIKALDKFNVANNAAWELEADKFVVEVQELASAIDKKLRPD